MVNQISADLPPYQYVSPLPEGEGQGEGETDG